METNEKFFQIGDIAKKSNVSVDTIRYYEKEGLLRQPLRSEGGFRKYTRESIERIHFIKRAKTFGLTLSEIKKIMRESEKSLESCCDHVSKILKHKLNELESKIKELQTMRKQLRSLVESWIPLKEAKGKAFVVCPQIELVRKQKKGGERHGEKKS